VNVSSRRPGEEPIEQLIGAPMKGDLREPNGQDADLYAVASMRPAEFVRFIASVAANRPGR
jgi:hypothetical protein